MYTPAIQGAQHNGRVNGRDSTIKLAERDVPLAVEEAVGHNFMQS